MDTPSDRPADIVYRCEGQFVLAVEVKGCQPTLKLLEDKLVAVELMSLSYCL